MRIAVAVAGMELESHSIASILIRMQIVTAVEHLYDMENTVIGHHGVLFDDVSDKAYANSLF